MQATRRSYDQYNPGGLFATFCEIVRPPRSEGFIFKGVANFLTKGGKKTPLIQPMQPTGRPTRFFHFRNNDQPMILIAMLFFSSPLRHDQPATHKSPGGP